MSADNTSTIAQYVSFEFFDSAGNVPTEFGTVLYFSNKEILGAIEEGEKTGTEIHKTRGGKAGGSSTSLPRSYQFNITKKYDRRTWGKIRSLIEAIRLNYRIRFRIHAGYLLWEEAFGTFSDYAPNAATTFDWAVVDIGAEPTYRGIVMGHGLKSGDTFAVTVYEGDTLPVPTENDSEDDGGDIETRGFNFGGFIIPIDIVA